VRPGTEQIAGPVVKTDAAACGATNLIIRVVNREMLKLGLNTFGEDHKLRDLIYEKVFHGIQVMQDPAARVLIAASAPAPTRAEALVASGLVDLAAWLTELADTLTKSVVAALGGKVSATTVNAAIKRTIVVRINIHGR
jgi:hypothetical protein